MWPRFPTAFFGAVCSPLFLLPLILVPYGFGRHSGTIIPEIVVFQRGKTWLNQKAAAKPVYPLQFQVKPCPGRVAELCEAGRRQSANPEMER